MEIRGLTILNQLAFDFIKKFIYYKTILALVLFSVALFSSAFAQDPCNVQLSQPQYMDPKFPNLARVYFQVLDPKLLTGEWEFKIIYKGSAYCDGTFIDEGESLFSTGLCSAFMAMDCWKANGLTLLFKACNTDTGECVECVLTPTFKRPAGSSDKTPTLSNNVVSYENDSNTAVDINIVNITGQVIQSESVAASSSTTFELKNVDSAGMYFIQVMQQGKM